MNKAGFIILIIFLAGCGRSKELPGRLPIAQVGKVILFYDEVPGILKEGMTRDDSASVIQNYINKWAKRELLLQKAEENLSSELRTEIDRQTEETRENLVIYQYQQQILLERMDTAIAETELENYYSTNEKSFYLSSNIVRALYIKLPLETPNLDKIKALARSNDQKDLQQLESYCYQFAENYDDFNERWMPMDELFIEFSDDIGNQENFLRRSSFFEKSDSSYVYLIAIRDYRLRSSLAPYDYVREDIKRIIWNNRRFEFLQALENGIYNDALKGNRFKIF